MNFANFLKNRLIVEMAIMGERPRAAIKLDGDDIEFLYQFPPQYWSQALYQRYNKDLYDALKQREAKRRKIKDHIVEKLKETLKTGKYSKLSGLLQDSRIKKIREDYDDAWIAKYKNNDEAIENAAEDIAYYATEELIPDADEPNEKIYSVGKGKRKDQVKAKPFINRLIHKLERTIGQEQDRKSTRLNSSH